MGMILSTWNSSSHVEHEQDHSDGTTPAMMAHLLAEVTCALGGFPLDPGG